jgi:hypothetical protein
MLTRQPQALPVLTPSPSVRVTVQPGSACQVPSSPTPGVPSIAGRHPAPNATQPLVPSESFEVRVGG